MKADFYRSFQLLCIARKNTVDFESSKMMNYEPTYGVWVFKGEIQDQIPPLKGPNMQNR